MSTPHRKPRTTASGAAPIRLHPQSRWTMRNLVVAGLALGLLSALVRVLESVKVRTGSPLPEGAELTAVLVLLVQP